MAALMTSVMGDAGQISKYIRNCTDMGIQVLPPSVNESDKKFTVEDGKIRFGLRGVKNVGEGAIDAIIKAREEKGLPKDIFSFISGVDVSQINKKAMESLIKAGALDCLDGNRAAHLAVYEMLMESAQSTARKNIEGQISLFQTSRDVMSSGDVTGSLPKVADFDKDDLLAMEKEMTGVYITDHPLSKYADVIRKVATVTSEDLAGVRDDGRENRIKDGQTAVVAGMITGKKTLVTKSHKLMAFIDVEDLYGTVEAVVFPNVYERCGGNVEEDRVVAIRGKIDIKEDKAPNLLADSIVDINETEALFASRVGGTGSEAGKGGRKNGFDEPSPVKVKIPEYGDEKEILSKVSDILRRHRGNVPVLIYLRSGKIVRTAQGAGVRPTLIFAEEVADLVGNANVKIEVIAR